MDDLLVETFPRGKRHFLAIYPFEGRLAHTTLAMLLTRRLERLGVGPIGFVASDYALAIWAARPMDGLDLDALFQEDMLGDDLESWLEESVMMKRAFKTCALISGLIERRFAGHEKSGRQVTFSSDLIYDVLRRHQPDHLMLRCAREDAATGLLDVGRLGDLLSRIARPHPPHGPGPRLALRRPRSADHRPREGPRGSRPGLGAGRGRRRTDRRGDDGMNAPGLAAPRAPLPFRPGPRPRPCMSRSTGAWVDLPAIRRRLDRKRTHPDLRRPAPGEGLGLRPARPAAAALRHPRDPAPAGGRGGGDWHPERIVFLGDTLHDGDAADRIAEEDAEALGAIARGRTLLWIVGNHDPEGPGDLPGETAVDELAIGGLTLRHEPQPGTRPARSPAHLHPCARVVAPGPQRAAAVFRHRRPPPDPAGLRGLRRGPEHSRRRLRRPVRPRRWPGALGQRRVHAVSWRSTSVRRLARDAPGLAAARSAGVCGNSSRVRKPVIHWRRARSNGRSAWSLNSCRLTWKSRLRSAARTGSGSIASPWPAPRPGWC